MFSETSHLILMTDGAACYAPGHPGILEHYTVNHSEKEWTRPLPSVLANAETGERKHGMAGTTLLDSTWKRLKKGVPDGLAVRTRAQRALKLSYIRAAQWKLMVASEQRWEAFCRAAEAWNRNVAEEKARACIPLCQFQKRQKRKRCNEVDPANPNLQDAVENQSLGAVELGVPVTDPLQRVRDVKKMLVDRLVSEFRTMAPDFAVPQYRSHLCTLDFERTLLREIALQDENLSDFDSHEALLHWLVLLVHRKEIDLAGMVRNARTLQPRPR